MDMLQVMISDNADEVTVIPVVRLGCPWMKGTYHCTAWSYRLCS